MSKKFLGLFVLIITSISITLNFSNYFMGNFATFFNFMVSITFLFLWFIFSSYCGKKQNKEYLKFILLYWGIDIISSILIVIVLTNDYNGLFLIPFSIWYNCPTYGIRYILNGYSSTYLVIVTMPLGLIFSFIGYYIGLLVLKPKKQLQ